MFKLQKFIKCGKSTALHKNKSLRHTVTKLMKRNVTTVIRYTTKNKVQLCIVWV